MIRKPGRDGKTAAQRHMAAIVAGTVTKTNVIGLRKAINHVERLRRGWSGNRSSVTPAEADMLEATLAKVEPTVTGELHKSGLKVLRSPRYHKRFNETQRKIIDSPHIRIDLVRFDRIGDVQTVPVYRVTGWAGNFLFHNIPWQSAYYRGEQSGPVVVGENR